MSSLRVRFAPSPTGQLHLGGLRTALYNYLFAKRHKGKFLLRIEDTDRERTVPGAIEQIKSGLDWAGIKFDEKPVIQSERVETYRKYINQLFGKQNHQNQDHVYRCFCKTERLMLLRHECKRRNQPYRYDGRCKSLTDKQKNEYLQQGVSHVIRFSLPTDESGSQTYDDLVYGEHKHNPYTNEGDFILLKSDGFPTYHLANVIDDHLMEISHVLRGHEWQTSTSKHLLLYKAFEWQPPEFGHLPLLERERGRKLSKRDPENVRNPIEIDFYRQKKYFADAVLNFITICGGGGFSNIDDVVGKTLNEMVPLFDIKYFSRHAAIVDFKKLEVCQRAHLKRAFQRSDEDRKRIFDELREKIRFYYPEKIQNDSIHFTDEYLDKTMRMIDFRISLLDELFSNKIYEFLWKEGELGIEQIDDVEQFRYVIQETLTNIDQTRFVFDDVRRIVEKDRTKTLDTKKVFRIWRLVFCNSLQGPPVNEIVTFLGLETVKKRLERVLSLLNRPNENVLHKK